MVSVPALPLAHDEAIWVDVKLKIEGRLLLRLEMRGYCSDSDMTVQLNYIADGLVMKIRDMLFIPPFVVTVFQGYNVIALSCEGGIVVSLD